MIYDFKFGYPNKTPEMLNNTLQMQNIEIILNGRQKL